jgi:hypothetical protein
MKYPQNPVTVVKGDHIVKDVYLSDLSSWQAEGYEILGQEKVTEEPEAIAPKPKAKKSTSVDTEQI